MGRFTHRLEFALYTFEARPQRFPIARHQHASPAHRAVASGDRYLSLGFRLAMTIPAHRQLPTKADGSDGRTWPASLRPPLAVAPFGEKTAKQHQARWAKYLRVSAVQTNSIGMRLILIPPGEFAMGSPKVLIDDEMQRREAYLDRLPGEVPQRRVRITRPFWLGATEVTQEEFQRVMGHNPGQFQGDPKRPVEQVSWTEAMEFCSKLSALPAEKGAGLRYSLPTEAQWEYACRAGSEGPWCFCLEPAKLATGDDKSGVGGFAWIDTNSNDQPHPVAQKSANAWGLFDMHGNLWELCQDRYARDAYATSPGTDPTGPPAGSHVVSRGGAFNNPDFFSRSAHRHGRSPEDRGISVGFRVAAVAGSK